MKALLVFLLALLFLSQSHPGLLPLQAIQNTPITISVEGEVNNPGSFSLPRFSTLEDLWEHLQFTPEADLTSFNPALILQDHTHLVIPGQSFTPKVSINTGTLEELMTLPGVGEATAQAIMNFRTTQGLFTSLEDIQMVKGIGPSKFEKMKEFIQL